MSELVITFQGRTIKIFSPLARKVAMECGMNVSGMKERLVFVKSGYLMGVYIPTMRDAKPKRSMREQDKYESRV